MIAVISIEYSSESACSAVTCAPVHVLMMVQSAFEPVDDLDGDEEDPASEDAKVIPSPICH